MNSDSVWMVRMLSVLFMMNLLELADLAKLNFKQFPLRDGRIVQHIKRGDSLITGRRTPPPLKNGRVVHRVNASSHICNTFKFNQTISHPGCHDKTIVNRGCFGYCRTMMHTGQYGGFDLTLQLGCINDRVKYRPVRLKCPGRKRGYKLKSVLIVKTCKCRAATPVYRKRKKKMKFPFDLNAK